MNYKQFPMQFSMTKNNTLSMRIAQVIQVYLCEYKIYIFVFNGFFNDYSACGEDSSRTKN